MFRDSNNPLRPGALGKGRGVPPSAGRPPLRQPSGRPESARLGIRCSGRAMQPAALRVLETTRRVWREPLV